MLAYSVAKLFTKSGKTKKLYITFIYLVLTQTKFIEEENKEQHKSTLCIYLIMILLL